MAARAQRRSGRRGWLWRRQVGCWGLTCCAFGRMHTTLGGCTRFHLVHCPSVSTKQQNHVRPVLQRACCTATGLRSLRA